MIFQVFWFGDRPQLKKFRFSTQKKYGPQKKLSYRRFATKIVPSRYNRRIPNVIRAKYDFPIFQIRRQITTQTLSDLNPNKNGPQEKIVTSPIFDQKKVGHFIFFVLRYFQSISTRPYCPLQSSLEWFHEKNPKLQTFFPTRAPHFREKGGIRVARWITSCQNCCWWSENVVHE